MVVFYVMAINPALGRVGQVNLTPITYHDILCLRCLTLVSESIFNFCPFELSQFRHRLKGDVRRDGSVPGWHREVSRDGATLPQRGDILVH